MSNINDGSVLNVKTSLLSVHLPGTMDVKISGTCWPKLSITWDVMGTFLILSPQIINHSCTYDLKIIAHTWFWLFWGAFPFWSAFWMTNWTCSMKDSRSLSKIKSLLTWYKNKFITLEINFAPLLRVEKQIILQTSYF